MTHILVMQRISILVQTTHHHCSPRMKNYTIGGAFPTVRGWTFPRFLDKEIDYNVARSCNCDNAVAYIDTSGSLWIWGLITSIA